MLYTDTPSQDLIFEILEQIVLLSPIAMTMMRSQNEQLRGNVVLHCPSGER